MATKSKVKEKKPTFLYPKLTFVVEEMPGCCGIGVVCHFDEDRGSNSYYPYRYHAAKKLFMTKKEQAKDCYNTFIKGTWDEDNYDNYSQLLVSLVSSYKEKGKKPQFQELQDLLIKEGWTIHSVFINPNHGNEVTLFGKYFPERDKNPSDDDYNDDEEYDDDE